MRFVAEQVGEGCVHKVMGLSFAKYGHFCMTLRFYRAFDTEHCAKKYIQGISCWSSS